METNTTVVKYVVHGKGTDNLPDMELSACGEPQKTQATAGQCDAKKDKPASSSGTDALHLDQAEVAKMIEEHEREAAELKKQKEQRKAAKQAEGRSSSNESVQETVQTQLKEKAGQTKKDEDAKPDSTKG